MHKAMQNVEIEVV